MRTVRLFSESSAFFDLSSYVTCMEIYNDLTFWTKHGAYPIMYWDNLMKDRWDNES